MNAAAPSITWAQVGLPKTPSKTATSRPPRWVLNSASTGNAASARSVTISGRLQALLAQVVGDELARAGAEGMAVGNEKRVMVMNV